MKTQNSDSKAYTVRRTPSRHLSIVILLLLIGAMALVACQPVQDGASPAADAPADTAATAEESTADEAEAPSDGESDAEAADEEGADDGDTAEPTTRAGMADGEPTETYKDIPVGFTVEGYPYRGSPDAPITMYEYSDYECPFCSRYFVQTEPALDESYVRSGQVRIVFRDMPLEQLHPSAMAAHVASLCAADQGATAYWNMHARIFATVQEWARSPEPPTVLAGVAEELGLDMDTYNECATSGRKEAFIEMSIMEARQLGFGGTPSFRMVNEETGDDYQLVGAQPYDAFASSIDTMLAGEVPVDPNQAQQGQQQEGSGEMPYWATAEGLAADPDRPGVNMAGDYYRGNLDAKVVVVEFSDLQCPFCRRHSETTQPVLDEAYVDTGEVLWVFKHFPLSIHPQAPDAGAAAECAAEQDASYFWEMQTLLFNNMSVWSISDPSPVFMNLADQLGLDSVAFEACLNNPEMRARVDSDMADGAPFVRGTPTFVVLHNGEGSLIPGALPAERFTQVLDEVIAGAQ